MGLRILTVQSPALGGRGDVAVHVPQGRALSPDAPVVLLLHGVYGSFWNWMFSGCAHLALDRLVNAGRVRSMVLVAPSDGMLGEGTAYLPHADADYEAWIMTDVVDCIGEFVDEVTGASPLLLGGNSMGGFGAARLGLRHRSRVAGIALHSAVTHLDQLAQFTLEDIGIRAGLDPHERSIVDMFGSHTDSVPPLYMDCGRSDPLAAANRELHQQLESWGVEHTYAEFDGAHDWDAWSARIEDSLLFFETVLEDVT